MRSVGFSLVSFYRSRNHAVKKNERESYSLDVNIPILDSDSRNYDDDNHLIVEAISCLFS